jgi:hypothetical protein
LIQDSESVNLSEMCSDKVLVNCRFWIVCVACVKRLVEEDMHFISTLSLSLSLSIYLSLSLSSSPQVICPLQALHGADRHHARRYTLSCNTLRAFFVLAMDNF